MYKQVVFYEIDADERILYGGIAHYNAHDEIDYVICGCCGGVMEAEEVEIVKVFDWWVPLCDEIIGDFTEEE